MSRVLVSFINIEIFHSDGNLKCLLLSAIFNFIKDSKILKQCSFESSLAGLRYVRIFLCFHLLIFKGLFSSLSRAQTSKLARGDTSPATAGRTFHVISPTVRPIGRNDPNDVTRYLTQFTIAHCLLQTDTTYNKTILFSFYFYRRT